MKLPSNIYFNIIQDCLSQLKDRLNSQPGIKVDMRLTITKQVMNLYEVNMKQVRSMLEQGLIDEATAKEHEEHVENEYKEKPNQDVLYLRLDREAIVTEVHVPEEKDFVPGFKYQRLIKGSWKDHVFAEKREPPKVDGTYRYIFKRRITDLIYNNSAVLISSKKKHDGESRQFLYKAMLYDLVGMGLQVSASEFQQEKIAKEKAMIEANQNEHIENNLRAQPGGLGGVSSGADKTITKGRSKIEKVSENRIDMERSIPIDEKYKKEIAKARKKAGIKDGQQTPQA